MAYVAPTATEFKARFPQFAALTDQYVQFFLDEATNTIDTSWRESDYKTAILYLAAHLVTEEQATTGAGGGTGTGSGIVSSESFGGMSISYDTSKSANDAAAGSQWGSTEYGRRFYLMLKANKPAIVSI